jgi:hypothetical protein
LAGDIERREAALFSAHLLRPASEPTRPGTRLRSADSARERQRLEHELGAREIAQHLESFGEPPVAPPVDPIDPGPIERRFLEVGSAEIPRWRIARRRGIAAAAQARAGEQAKEETVLADAVREKHQQSLDERYARLVELKHEVDERVRQWERAESERLARAQEQADSEYETARAKLLTNDAAEVTTVLRRVFSPSKVSVVGSLGGLVLLVIACPQREDAIADQEPTSTSAGRPTVRKRSQTTTNDLYAGALSSSLFAAAHQALVAAPGLTEVVCLLLRSQGTSGAQELLYAGRVTHDYLSDFLAGKATDPLVLAEALEGVPDAWVETTGRTRELVALEIEDCPGLAAVLNRIATSHSYNGAAANAQDAAAVRAVLADLEELRGEDGVDDEGGTDDRATTEGDVAVEAQTAPEPPSRASDSSSTDGKADGQLFGGADDDAPRAGRVTGFILAAIEDPDEGVRYDAFSALGDHLEPSMLPMIKKHLKDPDPYVRRKALEYCSELDC